MSLRVIAKNIRLDAVHLNAIRLLLRGIVDGFEMVAMSRNSLVDFFQGFYSKKVKGRALACLIVPLGIVPVPVWRSLMSLRVIARNLQQDAVHLNATRLLLREDLLDRIVDGFEMVSMSRSSMVDFFQGFCSKKVEGGTPTEKNLKRGYVIRVFYEYPW